MDCRSSIIINNDTIYLQINTSADYNFKKEIPLKQWFQLWRYELIIKCKDKHIPRRNNWRE